MEIIFCEYLINIGLINKESFSNFVLDYHKKFSNKNFTENMKDLLLNFFYNSSNEEKNYMSINLVKNFFRVLNVKKLEKLKAIYLLLKEKLSIIKLRNLFKWKIISVKMNKKEEINTFKNYEKLNNSIKKINSNIKRNRNTPNELDNFITMKINTNRERKKNHIINSIKNKNISSSQNESTIKKYDSTKESINPYKKNNKNFTERFSSISLKEKNELEECTFSPKINDYSKIRRNSYKNELNENKSESKRLFEIFNKLQRKI